MCVSIQPHAEWHYLHKWLPCLLQHSRVCPDWPLFSKPRQTPSSPRFFSTPALKCNAPVVRVHLWTNVHSPAPPPDLAVPDRLLPPPAAVPQSAWKAYGTTSCLRASWGWGLVVNVRCCWNGWNQHGTVALFFSVTISWKQHSRDWLAGWLILCRAATVRKGNEPSLLFNTVFLHVEPH